MGLQDYINPYLWEPVADNEHIVEEQKNDDEDTPEQANQCLQKVCVQNIPDNTVFFALDKETIFCEYNECQMFGENRQQAANQFLNKSAEHINKNCDGVFIRQENDELDIVFVEMKSKDPKPKKYENQLVNTSLFVDYLRALHATFNKKPLTVRRTVFALFYYSPSKDTKGVRHISKPSAAVRLSVETMQNHSHNFKKCAFPKTQHNYISWSDLMK